MIRRMIGPRLSWNPKLLGPGLVNPLAHHITRLRWLQVLHCFGVLGGLGLLRLRGLKVENVRCGLCFKTIAQTNMCIIHKHVVYTYMHICVCVCVYVYIYILHLRRTIVYTHCVQNTGIIQTYVCIMLWCL